MSRSLELRRVAEELVELTHGFVRIIALGSISLPAKPKAYGNHFPPSWSFTTRDLNVKITDSFLKPEYNSKKWSQLMAGEKILIVDDDLAHALLCQRLLERASYQALAVNNTADALNRLNTTAYDLLITDIRMPDMSGFELMNLAAQSNPDLAILLMTGFGSVENAVQALRFGADGLLLKPLASAGELVDSVASVLQKRQTKLDALRLNVLHPLFAIGEHIFAETTPELLSSLIVNDIRDQAQSSVTGIFIKDGSLSGWQVFAGSDLALMPQSGVSTRLDQFLDEIAKIDPYILLHRSDPRMGSMSAWMKSKGFRDMACTTVKRAKNSYLFYAIRSDEQPAWESPDLELLVIFARQAAVALENAQLYNELKDYIHQLEESQRSLIMAEKMAALGRLMASLAHELNNPLQGVQNCLHLAERSDLPESQRQEFILMARREVERVSALAQTAMEYYRPRRLIRQSVELIGLLETVLNLVEPQLRTNHITVRREFNAQRIYIEVIRDNIQQVILNLLLNAMDALVAHLDERTIWIEVVGGENEVEIFIEDSGSGISPSVEERLFEPFVSTKPEGSGLGLSISYELVVDVHGGELDFVPPLHGKGARVRILLPRKD